MRQESFTDLLRNNTYPGRGIMIGRSRSGKYAVIAYFIMGRSENSRNRIFVEDGDGIRTKAYDESRMTDPSLIIYSPVRVLGSKTIVTNGDQTDTIYDGLDAQLTFEQALRARQYEPDGPNLHFKECGRQSGRSSQVHIFLFTGASGGRSFYQHVHGGWKSASELRGRAETCVGGR